MAPRGITTEYRTNFLPPADKSPGRMPAFYATAPHKSMDLLASIRKPFGDEFRGSKPPMDEWLRRTKSTHFGAFKDSYPQSAPFSSDKDLDAAVRLPALRTVGSGTSNADLVSSEEKYKRRYLELLKRLKDKSSDIQLTQKLPGGGKGVWRHIKESYGAGNNLLSWVDGIHCESGVSQKKPQEFTGGKGTNRYVVDSHGAGPSVIRWVSGLPERELKYSTCLPNLPTPYQEQMDSNFSLRGGQFRKQEVRGLRD